MAKQNDIDKASDQAATQAAALVIARLKPAIKQAITDLAREYRRDSLEYLLHHKWIRALVGLLFIAGLIAAWIKEKGTG